jgi:hypothetical protein
MPSDEPFLPNPAEALVLHQQELLLTDELPDLAARWLASDLTDTDNVRMLAGHDRHDPWGLEALLRDVVEETGMGVPDTPAQRQRIAVAWVTSRWQDTRDTRWAVGTLAHLGQVDPDLDLGLFIGLDDEWSGCWGRDEASLREYTEDELRRLLSR